MQDKKLWLILALAVISIGSNFWGFPIYILDEARNSACAMEMMQRDDWVVPTFNGELRTDKPPLHYFFMIASYKVFGVQPFSARLFSVIMGVLTVWMVYFFVKKMGHARAAFYSAFVLLSSLGFVIEFHLAVPDPYLIFFLTASWLCFIYGYTSGKGSMYDLSFASMALAFMAKGPVAVALTGMIFGLFLLLLEDVSWKSFIRFRIGRGVLIFLAITMPWWIGVALATDGVWPREFILQHNVGRYSLSMEGHDGFPGVALIFVFVTLLPLAVHFPPALKVAWIQRRENLLQFFCLVAAGTVTVFFSFSKTILFNYTMPAIPFGAILIGLFIDRRISNPMQITTGRKAGSIVAMLVAVSLPFVLRSAIGQDKWIHDLPDLAWLFVPVSVAGLLSTYFVFRNQWEKSILSYLLAFWLTGVLLFYIAMPAIMARNPLADGGMDVINQSGREVVGYRKFNDALVFALKRPVVYFFPIESLREYIQGKRVIVITRKDHEAELQAIGLETVFEKPYLFENPNMVLMVNKP